MATEPANPGCAGTAHDGELPLHAMHLLAAARVAGSVARGQVGHGLDLGLFELWWRSARAGYHQTAVSRSIRTLVITLAVSDLGRRLPFLRSFALTLAELLGASQLVLPGRMKGFLQEVVRYQHCYGTGSILALALTYRGALVVNAALVGALAVAAWKFRSVPADSMPFSWTSCLVLSAAVLIIPTMYPTAQVVLVPAVFLLLQHGSEVFGSRTQKLTSAAALCVVVWPYIGVLVYLLLSTAIPIHTLRAHWLIPVSTVPVTPVIVLAALALRASAIFKFDDAKLAINTEQAAAVSSKKLLRLAHLRPAR